MSTKTKVEKQIKGQNPLESYTLAIQTLMYLAEKGRNQEIRMDAASKLLEYNAVPPNVDFCFEPDGDD